MACSNDDASSSSSSARRLRHVEDPCDAEPQRKAVERQTKTAVLRFNTKPQLGLEYVRGLGLWDGSPATLAAWLHDVAGLSKRRVGEFFGGTHPLAEATFEAWLHRSGVFSEASLDGALRALLRKFRLPGEAQCIDRIVARFARSFKKTTAWPHSEDAAYVLSFSIVMLNTDLHSASVKKRMTVDEFVANSAVEDVPRDFLERLYDAVKTNEITMDDGDLYESERITFMGARKAGYLEKFNGSQWRRLWFVLCDGCLYYFSQPADVDAGVPPRATIPLDQGLEVSRPQGAAPAREFSIVKRRSRRGSDDAIVADVSSSPSSVVFAEQHKSNETQSFFLTMMAHASGGKKQDTAAEVIKSVKKIGSAPSKVGTATELRLRAKDVADAQAWADALRAEEETLPHVGGAAAAAAKKAAALMRARRSPSSIERRPTTVSVAQPNSLTPLHAGWLRKRGEINTAWRTRYFALFSGVTCAVDGEKTPADEPVLMYFKDPSKLADLVDGKDHSYKGAVRLGAVAEMRRKHAAHGRPASIALVTKDRVWLLEACPPTTANNPREETAPSQDDDDDNLDTWWYVLEGACHCSRRYLAAAAS